jgi:hypothetical protein
VGFAGRLLGVCAERGHRVFLHHGSFGHGPVRLILYQLLRARPRCLA